MADKEYVGLHDAMRARRTTEGAESKGISMLSKRSSAVLVVVCVVFTGTRAKADDQLPPPQAAGDQPKLVQPAVARHQAEPVWPCIGNGYVPYSYPAFGTCPCGDNCCYDPSRYYCGGKSYRKQWFRKWLRTQVGRGSMLSDVPCSCRFPGTVKPYYRTVRHAKPLLDDEPMIPPAPENE